MLYWFLQDSNLRQTMSSRVLTNGLYNVPTEVKKNCNGSYASYDIRGEEKSQKIQRKNENDNNKARIIDIRDANGNDWDNAEVNFQCCKKQDNIMNMSAQNMSPLIPLCECKAAWVLLTLCVAKSLTWKEEYYSQILRSVPKCEADSFCSVVVAWFRNCGFISIFIAVFFRCWLLRRLNWTEQIILIYLYATYMWYRVISTLLICQPYNSGIFGLFRCECRREEEVLCMCGERKIHFSTICNSNYLYSTFEAFSLHAF